MKVVTLQHIKNHVREWNLIRSTLQSLRPTPRNQPNGDDRTQASDFSRNQLAISIQNSIHSISRQRT